MDFSSYQQAFSDLQNITDSDSSSLDIESNEYSITSDKKISFPKKWLNFDIVLKYRDVWFEWIRVFCWVFVIIYNINQITKILRRSTATDGGNFINLLNNDSGGKK